MNISILGCNGFLSTAIGKYANQKGWTLNMYGLDEPKGHSYDSFIKCNLMDAELDCSPLLDSDIIVYAIGAGIQSNLKEGFNLIYNLNVTAPVTICNKLKELNYNGVFVTFGSVFEMGETKDARLFTETDILTSTASAPSDYVVSKRMLTRFVTSYKHGYTHWHFIIPTIYGPGENPKRLIPYTIDAICNEKQLCFTSGLQVRQYINVNEIPCILENSFREGIPSGIYNISSPDIFTVKEIVHKIHSYFGIEVPNGCFGTASRQDVGMAYLALDGSKLNNLISRKKHLTIEEIIPEYLTK